MKINHQAHAIRYRQTPKDRYYTPVKLAKQLIRMVPLEGNDRVLDSCRGKGAFFHQFSDGGEEW